MTNHRYSFFHSFIQRIATTHPGAWFFAHFAHRFDHLFHRLTGSKKPLVSLISGLPALTITTTGAKSGKPRSLTLVYIREAANDTRLALIGSRFGQAHNPGWYYNLKANPRTTCTINGETGTYLAHEAQGEEYARFWQLATQVYPGYAEYKQRAQRHIPIMVLEREI